MLGGHLFRVFGLPPRRRHCAFSPPGVLRERATRGGGVGVVLSKKNRDPLCTGGQVSHCETVEHGHRATLGETGRHWRSRSRQVSSVGVSTCPLSTGLLARSVSRRAARTRAAHRVHSCERSPCPVFQRTHDRHQRELETRLPHDITLYPLT